MEATIRWNVGISKTQTWSDILLLHGGQIIHFIGKVLIDAIRQVDILKSISPTIRFIWVHAQNESNRDIHRQVASRGGFIEFDNLGWNPGQDSAHISAIKELIDAGYGDKILLSHDAGWYRPGVANGGSQKPYTYLTDTFVPKLKNAGLDDATIRMITEINPIRAFAFRSDE